MPSFNVGCLAASKQSLAETSSSAMAERTVQLSCVVPTPEKFTVQLLTVVLRQAGPACNMFVYVVTRGRRFSANI